MSILTSNSIIKSKKPKENSNMHKDYHPIKKISKIFICLIINYLPHHKLDYLNPDLFSLLVSLWTEKELILVYKVL
jgi:hypothetical protein